MKQTIKTVSYSLLVIGMLFFNACSNDPTDVLIPDNENEDDINPELAESSNTPTWAVSNGQSTYEYNMTYSSQIAFDGVTNKNAGTIVGAFVGDECRGFAKLTHETSINIYIFNLTIYSNEPLGEKVVIKAYDPDKKLLFKSCASFLFESDDVKGNVDEILNCVSK